MRAIPSDAAPGAKGTMTVMVLVGHTCAEAAVATARDAAAKHRAKPHTFIFCLLSLHMDVIGQRCYSSAPSRSQMTAPEWVTAPACAGRTVAAYFSSRPPPVPRQLFLHWTHNP